MRGRRAAGVHQTVGARTPASAAAGERGGGLAHAFEMELGHQLGAIAGAAELASVVLLVEGR